MEWKIVMEWFWYILASLGAGIGTGLAGLSAATVMVPMLIVLCPSFHGETGAYQATAIALASDILGSAVTSYTYAKHKNIDIKRAWLIMTCILTMCTVGSYAAFRVGNVVLGGFTLFLTFCIGIRFLVKPDTSRENPVAKGAGLGLKEILISIGMGIPIGFGTGFVGTGGGMMMLIIFSVFFGMEVKTAVGTSTFIMTFTALIASVSHILIHPAIVLEKWNVMLLCIVVATAASLISARFANRVKTRTVGLVTGVVLTVLGASMLVLNYWTFLSQCTLLIQVLKCYRKLAVYLIPCIIVLLPIRVFTKVPSFVFRKMLHVVAFSIFGVMILAADSWIAAVLTCVSATFLIYPILALLERYTWFENLLVQKSTGEIKRSFVMLMSLFAVLITVTWGVFDHVYLAVAAIFMWGPGDAAAALVGIPFGKHKVRWRMTDGKKSWEGSLAMLAVSFICGFVLFFCVQGTSLLQTILLAGLGALAGTLTELVSASEIDTITVPSVIAAVLLLVSRII